MTMTEPIDRTHAECMVARDAIRRHVATIRRQIHAWEPRPCPPHPDTTRTGETK